MLCESVLVNISLAIPDNEDITFAIERIIDFCHSIGMHLGCWIPKGCFSLYSEGKT